MARKVQDAPEQTRRYLDNPFAERRRATDSAPVAAVKPQAYPAWRYHESFGSMIVHTEAADVALGEGWSATPPSAAPVTYPAWRYHTDKAPQLVASAADDAALGEGWYATVQAAAAALK